MNNKYCCIDFERDANLNASLPMNIRIIKVDVEKIFGINKKYPYLFFRCLGFEEGDKNVARRQIHFCPFCGTKLKRFYKSDDYINQVNHDFMMIKTDKERATTEGKSDWQ